MDKKQIFNEFLHYLNNDIQSKDFLTYQEQDEWKDYLERIINNYTKEKDKEITRLNEIIDKLEKYLICQIRHTDKEYIFGEVYYKLKELKEEDK